MGERPVWADAPIEVVDWSSRWRVEAARLAQGVMRAGNGVVRRVGHVGSTSVRGLAAKPIVDLLADVADPEGAAEQLAAGPLDGWHLVPADLDDRAWRRMFVLPSADGQQRRAHLHLVTPEHDTFAATLRFRDRLRADPPLAAAYAQLKRELAARHRDDREAYTDAKAAFVGEVLVDDGPVVLSGGAVADPVRVDHPTLGTVVARRRDPWSDTVERLLAHVHDAGIPVPAVVGRDEHGRSLHRWVEGDTHRMPATPEEAGAVGGLLRALHDATRSFSDPSDAIWAGDRRRRRPGQVIGHGDVSWGNVVWRPGDDVAVTDGSPPSAGSSGTGWARHDGHGAAVPVGLLDLDHAEPRWPEEDLAEAAWQLVPLGVGWHGGMVDDGHADLDGRAARLAGLCAGYGNPRITPVVVVDALGARLREELRRLRDLAHAWPYDVYAARGDAARITRSQRWLAAHRRDLLLA